MNFKKTFYFLLILAIPRTVFACGRMGDFTLPEKLSPYLLAISLFVTTASFALLLIGTFTKKFSFAKKALLTAVIADLIFFYFYFSAHC